MSHPKDFISKVVDAVTNSPYTQRLFRWRPYRYVLRATYKGKSFTYVTFCPDDFIRTKFFLEEEGYEGIETETKLWNSAAA